MKIQHKTNKKMVEKQRDQREKLVSGAHIIEEGRAMLLWWYEMCLTMKDPSEKRTKSKQKL